MKRLVLSIGIVSIGIITGLGPATGQAIAQDHAVATTLKECGACHMAFPPQLLPARSWKKIMSGLSDHFGENADLAEPTRAEITAYLVAHAADAPGTANGRLFMRGVDPGAVPLRITQLPFWKAAHSEVPASEFRSAQVKSAANCLACHRSGGQGESGESGENE
jgi:cytochrome c551/c552